MRYPHFLKYLHERALPRNPLWYPGNPRTRLFLPQYWLKLVKHQKPMPKDFVKFECHWQMSSSDVKLYLEKVYKTAVIDVRVEIERGEYMQHPKKPRSLSPPLEDRKFVYVQLKNEEFKYPDIFGEKDPKKDELEKMNGLKHLSNKKKNDMIDKLGVNAWF